jgi:hypothetical protein
VIASQKIGKSFMGALNYNLKKLNHPDGRLRAELLDSNFTSLNAKAIKQEVDLIRQLRPNLGRYVYHTSLNFSKAEDKQLTNETLLAIAHDYLAANGFTNNQYLIFRHYDADHPHLHLLVNRITFDGEVVSDSNNYKKSEEILRQLERKYGLMAVTPSKSAKVRAPVKDEIEMVLRTKRPSEKMVMQEKLKKIINKGNISVAAFIASVEKEGIHLLFNQASTGRVSGITYFSNGFKIKGQALGNQFKWAELIRKINYEQDRDGEAIGEANSRTRAIYGSLTDGSAGLHPGDGKTIGTVGAEQTIVNEPGTAGSSRRERALEADQDAFGHDRGSVDPEHNRIGNSYGIEITDDVDDEAIHGRNRHRRRQTRGLSL